jgi:hypothetical protein
LISPLLPLIYISISIFSPFSPHFIDDFAFISFIHYLAFISLFRHFHYAISLIIFIELRYFRFYYAILFIDIFDDFHYAIILILIFSHYFISLLILLLILIRFSITPLADITPLFHWLIDWLMPLRHDYFAIIDDITLSMLPLLIIIHYLLRFHFMTLLLFHISLLFHYYFIIDISLFHIIDSWCHWHYITPLRHYAIIIDIDYWLLIFIDAFHYFIAIID